MGGSFKGNWATNLERAEETLVNAHHGTSIVEFSAVVGCAEQSHELALGEKFVTILDNLVGTADEIHVMLLEEARDDVRSECEGDTTVVLAPPGDVLVRVRPQQVAEQTTVRDLWRGMRQYSVSGFAPEPSPGSGVKKGGDGNIRRLAA